MKRFVGAAVMGLALAGCDGSDGVDASSGVDAAEVSVTDVSTDATEVTVDASRVADAATDVADATADVTTADVIDATADVTTADVTDADVEVVNGCPTWRSPVARAGDPPGDDRYAVYARGFFDRYCVRCHATTLHTPEARMGAPDAFNWDDEATIRRELVRIRAAVGVDNYMPLSAPTPTCDERRRLVRWIDLGAP